jgi:dihydroorotate dehydrogenase (NAD+) catalytic subunit
MIDLAPGHKQGLVVGNPVLVGSGVVGYGELVPRGLELSLAGAAVVGPLLNQSRSGASFPRIAETVGGLVLAIGLQNRGVNSVLSKFARFWPRLGCPVVVQIAENDPRLLSRLVERLAPVKGITGLELMLLTQDVNVAQQLVCAAQSGDLPIWVKLPLAQAADWAEALVEAGASGLVVGQAPPAALGRSPSPSEMRGVGALVRGGLYGPLAFAPMLERLAAVAELRLPCALIAAGGIHAVDQVRQALATGADAVQLDTALWVEPALLGWVVAALAGATTGPA